MPDPNIGRCPVCVRTPGAGPGTYPEPTLPNHLRTAHRVYDERGLIRAIINDQHRPSGRSAELAVLGAMDTIANMLLSTVPATATTAAIIQRGMCKAFGISGTFPPPDDTPEPPAGTQDGAAAGLGGEQA